MTSIDYSLFRKRKLQEPELQDEEFDVFVSSYNDSDRVQNVFNGIRAQRKIWLIHPEYGYGDNETPAGVESYVGDAQMAPAEYWQHLFDSSGLDRADEVGSIAFDITGMMRPHLVLLPLMLRLAGYERAVFFYSDPVAYISGDATTFSKGPVSRVGLIPGLEGSHLVSTNARDVLIIGAGYDHALVHAAAETKRSADHYLMVGLPSLQPHMYQESVFRISAASESIRDYRSRSFLFAPANDPFVAAQVLSDKVSALRNEGKADNIYLSPLGPKAQVLGFAWYYLCEARRSSTSMLFPFSPAYSRETSRGLASIHRFDMELDMILH